MSGRLFIKDENGQYTPFPGIQDCTGFVADNVMPDEMEAKYANFLWRDRDGFTITIRQTKQQSRKTMKWIRRVRNHHKRIHRHEKRLKERARRSVLKQKDWFVLRDKDGGQVCIDWHKRPREAGRFFIRYKRKRVKGEIYAWI